MQMAQKLQPSVLFIDGAHKPFIKKATGSVKEEDPRKLGKLLVKAIVKNISSEDAIMLIGVTNEPWNSKLKQMKQCYEKIVFFPPKLDYGTALMAWNRGLELKGIVNFDCSALAQVTRDYAIGDILDSIDAYIQFQRMMM
jgi:hypothetical protein